MNVKKLSVGIIAGLASVVAIVSSSHSLEGEPAANTVRPVGPYYVIESLADYSLSIITSASETSETRGGMQALVRGVLSANGHGCVGLESGGSFSPFLFPVGTTLSSDGTIELNGSTFSIGESVSLSGGSVPAHAALSAACGHTQEVSAIGSW